MKTFSLAALVALLVASAAVADIPPPAPPKGKKYADVSSKVLLDKGVTGYTFVLESGSGPGRPMFTYKKLELSTEKAQALPTGGRRSYVSLIAVPEAAAREFKTDAELLAAVEQNKVKGTQRLGFTSTTIVSDQVKGTTVDWTYTITAIDEKGVKAKVEGEGSAKPEPKTLPPEKPLAQNGPAVAGIAAALAVLMGGLWAAGRARRKV